MQFLIQYLRQRKAKKIILGYLIILFVYLILAYFIKNSNNLMVVLRFTTFPRLILIGAIFLTSCFSIIFYLSIFKKISWVQYFFYGTMLVSITGILIIGYITHGESIRSILHTDRNDALMDFFNSIKYGMKPYASGVIYPPLINVFYGLLGRFMVKTGNIFDLRFDQLGVLVFGTYIIVFYSFLFYVFIKLKNGKILEKLTFVFVTYFSTPFLFLYDRANSVLLAMLFSLMFVCYYRSNDKTKRLLSYICLAIAAGIKITPALLGVLLLREKKIKQAIVAVIIGIVIFLFPFVLTDGNILSLFQNITQTDQLQELYFQGSLNKNIIVGSGGYVNLTNIFRFMGRLFNFNVIDIAGIINVFVLLYGTTIVILNDEIEEWKAVGLLCCIIALIPSFSAIYNLVYMVIPLLLFLNSKPKLSLFNFLYCLLFIGIFVPIINFKIPAFNIFLFDWHPLKLVTVVESFSLFFLAFLFLLDFSIPFYKQYFSERTSKFRCFTCGAVLLLTIGIYGWQVGFKVRPIRAFYPANVKAGKAISGFSLVHGLYQVAGNESTILLQAEEVLKKGLMVRLEGQDDLKSQEKKVTININGFVLKEENVPADKNFNIFIPPSVLNSFDVNSELKVKLSQQINHNFVVNQFPIAYVGPALSSSEIHPNDYLPDANGIYRDKHNNLWLGMISEFIINKKSFQEGLLIYYDAPEELFVANSGKKVYVDFLVNNKLIKSAKVEKDKNFIIINAKEVAQKAAFNNDESMILGIHFSADYNTKDMLLDNDSHTRSVNLKYIGNCFTPQEFPWKNNKKIIFVNTANIFDSNMVLLYTIDSNKQVSATIANINIILSIDGEKIISKKIPFTNNFHLDAFSIPLNYITSSRGIVKIEVLLDSPSSNSLITNDIVDGLGITMQYVGANSLTSSLQGTDKVELHKVSKNLSFNKKHNLLEFGAKTDVLLLPKEINNRGFCLKYEVSPLLLHANKNVGFILYINGVTAKDVTISKAGIYNIIISHKELKNLIDNYNEPINITIMPQGLYNTSTMLIDKENKDRSIDIHYIGPIIEE